MNHLKFYYQIIEKAIAQVGLNPETARTDMGKWTVTKNNIPVWVEVFHQEKERRNYFMVGAPVMKVPAQNQTQFYLELLRENNNLYGVAFVENKGVIYLKTLREAEGLDVSEANAMILRVGNYADHYKGKLENAYPAWTNYHVQADANNAN